MPSFIEDLWSSVFTPGPTPTLLIATNVTFAALQLLLLALLLATYSVHFIVLSALSAGLWWSINWFAREVRLAQAAQEKEKRSREGTGVGEKDAPSPSPPGAIPESGESDTETEVTTTSKNATIAASGSGSLHPPGRQEVRKRASMTGGDNSSGYGSTDSEWEKVDEQ